jgi:hypothetical protein
MSAVVDIQAKVEAFDFEVNMADRFRLDGVVMVDEIEFFEVRDFKYGEDSEESHVHVPVTEVCDKPIKQIMACLNQTRKPIVCEGVTRIVGYYSRVDNWNKSKIGELRDRQSGRYGQTGFEKSNHDEAVAYVNAK